MQRCDPSSSLLIIGQGTEGNKVYLSKIGTDAAGTGRLGNGFDGVEISDEASRNEIGAPGLGNIISANVQNGVRITAAGTRENRVRGNFIGTNDTGADLGNRANGVLINQDAGPSQIGTFRDFGDAVECGLTPEQESEGNVIGRNSGAGVAIVNTVLLQDVNQVDGNYIGVTRDNRLIGNLGDGVLIFSSTSNTVDENVIGNNGLPPFAGGGIYISGSAENEFRCNFIGTDRLRGLVAGHSYGEGETFVGEIRVRTDGMGNRVFLEVFPTPVPVGHVITATATDPDGNTSEFSACKEVTAP